MAAVFLIFLMIFLVPLLGGILMYLFGGKLGNYLNGVIAALLAGSSFILSVVLMLYPPLVKKISITIPWISVLGVRLSLYFDALTALSLIVSLGAACMAVIYSVGYFKDQKDFDGKGFYSLVLIFLAGLIGVFISSNLILFYLFWEMMLLPTFCFVAYFGEDKEKSGRIALKYFIFTHIGAVLMLFGILLLFSQTGTSDILLMRAVLPLINPHIVLAGASLFMIGFAVKMAIFPFHSWLPETYANAPTPATVLMSAVMMNAPIYGFLRFFHTLLPRNAIEPLILIMLVFAVFSQFYGAILAMCEKNIKRMIAYSSISQMGYVLFGIGTMTYLGSSGAAFHMINHTLIKALLFMTVGAVFLTTKEYNIKKLGGLAAVLPVVALVGTVGALAISGVPLFSAFQSEWMIFAGGFATAYPVLACFTVAGAIFTAAYALRFIAVVFFGSVGTTPEKKIPLESMIPMVVIALTTLLIGIYPWYFSKIVSLAIRMLGA